MRSIILVFFCGLLVAAGAVLAQPESRLSSEETNSALLQAAEQNDAQKIKDLLQQGCDVDAENAKGWTPLTFAAKAGNETIVKLLVEKGANVNHRSSTTTGSTILCFSTDGNNAAVIEYLLAHGADINGKARNGTTPLQFTCFQGNTNLAALLISKGADLNLPGQIDDQGHSWTPLMTAANSGRIEMIHLLISRGAQLEQTNNKGETALMNVAKRDFPNSVKTLVEKGANVNARGPFGHTALIFAGYNGQVENIRMLLAAGADPLASATDSPDPASTYRYTAADLAIQQEHPEALALIRAAEEHVRAEKRPVTESK